MEKFNINDFKITRKDPIGSGGFGRVFLVTNKKDKQLYAAKFINSLDEEQILFFSREVNILSKIEHPAILKFIGFSSKGLDGEPYPTYIMEYAVNNSLAKILKDERHSLAPVEWDDNKKYFNIYGIAYGMSFLHANNIIHRDLKPDNIMEDDYLLPKIGDFGLSKIHDPKQRSDRMTIGGTPTYMAPELFLEDTYSNLVDVYAFSIILFEILTGEEPYKELNNLNGLPTKVANNYRPKIPAWISSNSMLELMTRCWSQNPNDRPQFSEIVEILKDPDFINNSGLNVDQDDFVFYDEYISQKNEFDKKKESIFKIDSFIKKKENTSIRRVGDSKKSFSLLGKGKKGKAKTEVQLKRRDDDDDKIRDSPKPPNASNKSVKITIFPLMEYQKLSSKCKELVKQAESGNENSALSLALNLINGENSFKQNIQVGIEYLNILIEKSNVQAMEFYGLMLLEGTMVPKKESKAIEILTKAANLNSINSKLAIAKYLFSKENNFDEDEINYFLAKKYAKEAADSGNLEAITLYGILCLRNANNKYGKVQQNIQEAHDSFKFASDKGYPDGIAHYANFLRNPYGLFTPDIEKSCRLAKKAADKRSPIGMARHALNTLNGFYTRADFSEGWKLMKKAMKKGEPSAYFFYGKAIYYGNCYGVQKDKDEGFANIKKAAMGGNLAALYTYAMLAEENHETVDVDKIRKKLIERGFIFDCYNQEIFTKYKDYDFVFKSDAEANKNNYQTALKILETGFDIHFVDCFTFYGILLIKMKKGKEAEKYIKKAADYGNVSSIKKYIECFEKGSFGGKSPAEILPYKKILEIYKK